MKTERFLLKNKQHGYIIRQETGIQGESYKNGIVPIKTEGERVAKGESVFRYYSNNEENLVKKIEELDSKIDEALSKEKDLFPRDIKILEKQIDEKLQSCYQENDLQKISEYKKDIESYVTKKATIAGEASPAGSYMKKLIEERSGYEKELNSSTEYVQAPTAGIVSYRIDGLENVLTPDSFSNITKESLEELKIKTGQMVATSNERAKIINNYECYVVCILDSERARQAEVGKSVSLRLANSEEVKAKIEYKSEEEDSVILVFQIHQAVETLISYRKISVDVIWWDDEGLKVPNSAIVYDEEKAYIVRNKAGYLDKILIKVTRQNESYSIIENYETEELKELGYTTKEIVQYKGASLYDEIVLNPNLNKAN